MSRRILVVEDNAKHLDDARAYAADLIECEVDFATTLAEAMVLLTANKYDGVISDVFFPADDQSSADTFENALALNKKLREMRIHHVFNTAGNHHGKKYDGFLHKTPELIWVPGSEYPGDLFVSSGMVIEAYPHDSDGEHATKQWQAAFRYILLSLAFLEMPDMGQDIVQSQEHLGEKSALRSFPYGDYGELTEKFWGCMDERVLAIFAQFNA
ncbi:MAG: response regulator [Candidatus Magasanikbacteria bacterium]